MFVLVIGVLPEGKASGSKDDKRDDTDEILGSDEVFGYFF